MAATIPINAPVTLAVNGRGGSWSSAFGGLGLSSGIDELQAAVSSALNNYGLFPVSVNLNATNIIPAVTWPFTGTIIVRPTYDTNAADLAGNVAQAIQDATGNAGTVAVTKIGTTLSGDAQPLDDTPDAGNGLPPFLKSFFDELKKDATWIAVGGVGLVALIVVAVAYGPNVKKLATL